MSRTKVWTDDERAAAEALVAAPWWRWRTALRWVGTGRSAGRVLMDRMPHPSFKALPDLDDDGTAGVLLLWAALQPVEFVVGHEEDRWVVAYGDPDDPKSIDGPNPGTALALFLLEHPPPAPDEPGGTLW